MKKILNFLGLVLLRIMIYGFPSLFAASIIIRLGSLDLKKEFFIGWIISQLVWFEVGKMIDRWVFSKPVKTAEQEEESE
jgi:hypothetical protein